MYKKDNIFKKSKYLNLLGEAFFMFDKNEFECIRDTINPADDELLNALSDIMQLLEYFFLKKLSDCILYRQILDKNEILELLQNLVNNWDKISKNEYIQWRKIQKKFQGGQKWS